MKEYELKLPSNKKFGFFFTIVFFICSCYFWFISEIMLTYIFLICCGILFFLTLINSDLLETPKNLWMKFGLYIGIIINPIVLGIIYFVLITPYALIMRLFGRDELQLKFKMRKSYWKFRNKSQDQTDFTRQF